MESRLSSETVQVEIVADPSPVFVDASGRRGRKLRTLGYVAGGLTAAYAVALGISLVGGPVSPRMLLPVPGMPDSAVLAAEPSESLSPVSDGKLERSSGADNTDTTKIAVAARPEMVAAPKKKTATAGKPGTSTVVVKAPGQPAPATAAPVPPAQTTAPPPVVVEPPPPVVTTEPPPPPVTEPPPPPVTEPPPPVTEDPPAGGTGAGGAETQSDPDPTVDPTTVSSAVSDLLGDVGVTLNATTVEG